MLYSSGTTGYPKGIKNPNPEREIGNPGPFVPGIVQSFGINGNTVYLSPAPLYHAAPLRFCMAMHRMGGHDGGHGTLRAGTGAAPNRALSGHPEPVGADDVCAHAENAGGYPRSQ